MARRMTSQTLCFGWSARQMSSQKLSQNRFSFRPPPKISNLIRKPPMANRKLQPSQCSCSLSSRSHASSRPQNFDQVVNGNQFVLVDFYAPWCPACKALAPTYAAAGAQLKAMGVPVVMAKIAVDTDGGQLIGNRYNLSTIPTLIWFANGKPQTINLRDGKNWLNSSTIVLFVASNTASAPPSAPPSAVPDSSCVNGRLGGMCLTTPAPAFYFALSTAFVHLVQAVAWFVVARAKQLFSFRHFCVVLLVPIFGLFLWVQLCRSPMTSKNRDTLLRNLHGEA